MRNLATKNFVFAYKSHPAVDADNRSTKVKNFTLFSFGAPIATYLPAQRAFLVLAEVPEHPKAAYIAHHLYDAHEVLSYALRVPFLLPRLPTADEIRGYHNEKLVALQRQQALAARIPIPSEGTTNIFARQIAHHESQLRLLTMYFPNADLPQSLPDETEIAAAEAAGFVSLPRTVPPMKSASQQLNDTHGTSYALVRSFFDNPMGEYFMRYKRLHKPMLSAALFHGRTQLTTYSKQSHRFYVLADHNDPKILAILREIHDMAESVALRRTVYLPNFDSTDPETNQRIYNRHLMGISQFITNYTRDCSGARDTALRFKTIHRAATRYFRLTNAPDKPFVPTDPHQLAALRRYGAFRNDAPDNA